MTRVYIIILLLIGWTGLTQAQYDPPSNYYAIAAGKTGSELKDALHGIISNHIVKATAMPELSCRCLMRILAIPVMYSWYTPAIQ